MASKKLHAWTQEEDDLLIECLVEIHEGDLTESLWLKQIEIILNEKLPGCGIKVPDINYCIKTMKKDWHMIYEMLHGANNPGFGWDPIQKCVIAEVEVWDELIKVNKKAALVHSKIFPHFDAQTSVFFRDGTSGIESQVLCDVVDELEALYDELLNVDGINDKERQDAYLKLVKDKVLRAKFLNLPHDTKKKIVRELLL